MHASRRSLLILVLGLAVALFAVLGSERAWPVWVWFWLAIALAHLSDGFLAVRASSWSVELETPAVLPVGVATPVRLEVRTARARSFRVEVHLDLSEELRPVGVLRLDGRDGRAATTVRLAPERRGRARIERVWLRYGGPLGLLNRVHTIDLDWETTAAPDLGPVRATAIRLFSTRQHPAGLKIERYVGEGSEFESLREFRPGHDPRAVDWKSSARHVRLLVRQFRAERNHQIILAVDCGRLMGEPIDGIPRLDHAIHASLTLAYVGMRTGDRVGLYSFDSVPRVFLKPRAGVQSFLPLLQRTGGLAYSTDESNFTLGLTDLRCRLTRRSLVIVLTDFVDAVTAELMVENLGRLARRHLILFVSLRDPSLTRLTRAEPRSLHAINRAVVAHTFLREREIVLRRLRRSGIQHLDVPPRQLSAGLVNRYLEIKRQELV